MDVGWIQNSGGNWRPGHPKEHMRVWVRRLYAKEGKFFYRLALKSNIIFIDLCKKV